jgi:predicted transcriptional regulator
MDKNMDKIVREIASYLSCKNDIKFNVKRVLIIRYGLKCIEDFMYYMCPICYKIYLSDIGLYLHLVKKHREFLMKIATELKDLFGD